MAKAGKHSAKCKRYATAHGQTGKRRLHKGHHKVANGVIIPMVFGALLFLPYTMQLHGYRSDDK